jgi:hypothetical protein
MKDIEHSKIIQDYINLHGVKALENLIILSQNIGVDKENADLYMENKISSIIQEICDKQANTNIEQLNNVVKDTIYNVEKDTCDIKSNLSSIMLRFENSSVKGRVSENILSNILQDAYRNAEIYETRGETASGDFIIKRNNKTDILVENKDYSKNVSTDQVKKFKRDIEHLNMNGIFLSQSSGIALKKNYTIDIINNNVLIYVHNVKYDIDKIKIAVNIIDQVSKFLKTNKDTGLNIKKDKLKEYNDIISETVLKKQDLIAIVKRNNKDVISRLEELDIPDIVKFINRF